MCILHRIKVFKTPTVTTHLPQNQIQLHAAHLLKNYETKQSYDPRLSQTNQTSLKRLMYGMQGGTRWLNMFSQYVLDVDQCRLLSYIYIYIMNAQFSYLFCNNVLIGYLPHFYFIMVETLYMEMKLLRCCVDIAKRIYFK